jgi:hypothetical protein
MVSICHHIFLAFSHFRLGFPVNSFKAKKLCDLMFSKKLFKNLNMQLEKKNQISIFVFFSHFFFTGNSSVE